MSIKEVFNPWKGVEQAYKKESLMVRFYLMFFEIFESSALLIVYELNSGIIML